MRGMHGGTSEQMQPAKEKIILASASPRRRELLEQMGVPFEVLVSNADENVIGTPQERVRILAERKARSAARHVSEGLILGADTLISLDGRAIGKPADEEDARFTIMCLSGRTHSVLTGVCLLDVATGRVDVRMGESSVTFKRLTRDEINAYIATGEYEGKAGSYAIQGIGESLIEKYEGSYSNIVGLPVELVAEMLKKAGWQR